VTTGHIKFQTIPYAGDSHDSAGRYILKLKDLDTLHAFFAQLSADPASTSKAGAAPTSKAPAPTVAPASVTVDVFNGSRTAGLAAGAASALRATGFQIGRTGNADASTYAHTEIRYAAGDQARAAAVAKAIPGATTAQSTDPKAGTVQLILGSDFTRVGQAVTRTAPASSAAATQGEDQRTAADTTCIN
jgi:hypothetical protein